jgi:hypothetical protein
MISDNQFKKMDIFDEFIVIVIYKRLFMKHKSLQYFVDSIRMFRALEIGVFYEIGV